MMRHILFSYQGTCNLCNVPVFPFYNSILLWSVSACKLPAYTMLLQKIWKLFGEVLSPSIWPQCLDLHTYFLLSHSFEFLKVTKNFAFVSDEIDPYFSSMIINEGNLIPAAMHTHSICWTPNICMYHFKWLLTYITLMWKWALWLLSKLACCTHFMHTIDLEFGQSILIACCAISAHWHGQCICAKCQHQPQHMCLVQITQLLPQACLHLA